MNNPHLPDKKIAKIASDKQQLALNCNKSIWVSANAGTGKTTVLIKRLLGLMIKVPACKPQEIIALTFAKSAAKEMLNKLLETVENLSQLSEEELHKNLTKLLSAPPTKTELKTAKNLYNLVLDSPPEISTVHSFCHKLLAKFPTEAGVNNAFVVMEEADSKQILTQAKEEVLVALAKEKNKDFKLVVSEIAEASLDKIFNAFLGNKNKLERILFKHSGHKNYLSYLAKKLEISTTNLEEFMGNYLPSKNDLNRLSKLTPWLEEGGKRDNNLACKIQKFTSLTYAEKLNNWQKFKEIFMTAGGTPVSKLASKKLIESNFSNYEFLLQMQEFMANKERERKAINTYLRTSAIVNVGVKIVKKYAEIKLKNNLLDYDDLIHKTADLLNNKSVSAWINYKLDNKIKHLLIDEGQDTNAEDWAIAKALTEEFFSGNGQHESSTRTLFAVGDIKQSIYRFRGAQPEVFSQIWEDLQTWNPDKNNIERVDLETSFRTSPAILKVVDEVFADSNLSKNLANEEKEIKHISAYPHRFGLVELWPLVKSEKSDEEVIPWELPKISPVNHNAKWQVANRVAKTILSLINGKQILASTGQHIDAKDIVVLIRSRACLPTLLERFHHYKIPTIVNSKSSALEHPIVQDLMALAKFLSNKNDNLSLTHTLQSPIFGWNHKQILDLHKQRKPKQPMWDILFNSKNKTAEILTMLLNKTGFVSVYELLTLALHLTDARGNFIHHFGDSYSPASAQNINGVIDAFLTEAFNHTGQLDSFIYNLSQNDFSLPANSGNANAVQIMTVHGAKGLEAPIIFMPDTTATFGSNLSKEYFLWEDDLFIAKTNKTEASALQSKLKENEISRIKQDELRLLYVALTRAKERLYIAGEGTAKECECWYSLISKIATTKNGWVKNNEDFVFTSGEKPVEISQEENKNEPNIPLPKWALEKYNGNKTTTQSGVKNTENENAKQAKLRGTNIHKLLEILPTLNIDNLPTIYTEEEIKIAQQTIKIFPQFFGKNSRAEVSIATQNFNGIIDRLIVTQNTVEIIDFKTDSTVPANIPANYAKQLKGYANCVKEIYPKHKIKCAILWTQENRLDWLD